MYVQVYEGVVGKMWNKNNGTAEYVLIDQK